MHVGIVALSDVDASFDLANTVHQDGSAVSLYLSYARTARAVNSPDRPEETVFEQGILDRGIQMRLFHYPRMRDPRSLSVIYRMIKTMHADGIDVAHILAGNGELWLAVLALLLRHAGLLHLTGVSRHIPAVSTMIIPQPNIGDQLPVWANVAINQLLANNSDIVIVNGENQVRLVRQMYRVSPNRLLYVPLCARITAVRWSREKITEEPGTILFFGRVEQHKGLEFLVRAQPFITRRVPDARIVIAGYGADLERCRRMIQDSGKFEIHEGFSTGSEMAAFFQKASLVALPYLSASTSGIVGTAYGFGKPVVATSVGCLPEYVQDGITGRLVPPRDSEQLADAIVSLLSDEEVCRRMGENARQWVSKQQRDIACLTRQAYQRAIETQRLSHKVIPSYQEMGK